MMDGMRNIKGGNGCGAHQEKTIRLNKSKSGKMDGAHQEKTTCFKSHMVLTKRKVMRIQNFLIFTYCFHILLRQFTPFVLYISKVMYYFVFIFFNGIGQNNIFTLKTKQHFDSTKIKSRKIIPHKAHNFHKFLT